MNTSIESCIESLPDELWLQLFSYIPACDLYYIWGNLNSRISAILHSARISIYIPNTNDEDLFYEDIGCPLQTFVIRRRMMMTMMMKYIITHFSSQIMSIKDERVNTTPSSQIPPVDLRSCENCRSLYLARCSPGQFEQLLHLHQLTRLSIPWDYVGRRFFERFVIGKDRKHFPHLRSIGRMMCFHVKEKQSSSFTVNRKIQHVHLVIPSSDSTARFFQYLPELSLITVDYLANEPVSSGSCFIRAKIRRLSNEDFSSIFPDIGASSKPELHSIAERIFDLEIDFHRHCDFTELAFVLQQCPILEKVRIRVKYYPNDLDLASIHPLNSFFTNLAFGEIQKDTGKPMIITK